MSYKVGDEVEVVDIDAVVGDKYLEKDALGIISSSNFRGEVTKIFEEPDGDIIFSVGFKNDLGWVTQGFKENELKGVE